MKTKLFFLSPWRFYPDRFGGILRIENMAKMVRPLFNEVWIHATDEHIYHSSFSDGIHLNQVNKYKNWFDKWKTRSQRLFSKNYGYPIPQSVYPQKNEAVFQIEDPLFYHSLKKAGIDNFILDEQNVNWDFSSFPATTFDLKLIRKFASNHDRETEILAIENAASVLVCSDDDKKRITDVLPGSAKKITLIPNCVDFDLYTIADGNSREEKSGQIKVLFLGMLSYFPNRDAAVSIINEIAPRLPDIDFIIAGRNPPQLNIPPNVTLTGYVQDIQATIRDADICIAPIRFGGGTRLKILEYMALQKPIIATSKGAEGLFYTNEKNIIIADTIPDFIEKIEDLAHDKEKRERLGSSARSLIQSHYDWKLYRGSLEKIYSSMVS